MYVYTYVLMMCIHSTSIKHARNVAKSCAMSGGDSGKSGCKRPDSWGNELHYTDDIWE